MATEPWLDQPQAGDVLSRAILLDEIRSNLIAVLSDYLNAGDDSVETALITRAETLFLGEIIPSRRDWETLNDALRTLATIKEQGTMYEGFLSNLDDSLGLSDLERIQAFLDAIQRLAPQAGKVQLSVGAPTRYFVTNPTHNVTTVGDNPPLHTVHLNWTLANASPSQSTLTFNLTPSASEDVAEYTLETKAGTYTGTQTLAPNEASVSETIVWSNHFSTSELADVSVISTLTATDKRGNQTTSMPSFAKLPASTPIPQGVNAYEVEYSLNNGNYALCYNGVQTTCSFAPKPITGIYRFRVRAIDANGQSYGGQNASGYTDWAYSTEIPLTFLPEKPDVPQPTVTTTWIAATVTWPAVARAEWYEVWMGDEWWARNNEGSTHNYWQRVELNEARSVTLKNLNQGKTYTFYVRAGNPGGTSVGSAVATIKVRTLHSVNYNSTWSNVFKTDYNYRNYYGNISYNKAGWYPTNNVYQGEWVDAPWGSTGWSCGRGGGYCAWGGQQWGNNMSFIYFDYGRMRNELRGKVIQSVTIILRRIDDATHGWSEAQPLYLYGHDRWQDYSTSSPNALTLFHGDSFKTPVNIYNQQPIANIQFNYGETENITNAKTKGLVEGIVAGRLMGLGIVKYYGESLYNHAPQTDKAYMILSTTMTIRVNYYDN